MRSLFNKMKNLINKSQKDDIDSICNQYKIENYSINSDGSIDVNGDVELNNMQLKKLPLKFNKVSGDFHCIHNQITSLVGGPVTVGGDFACGSNRLSSLIGSPHTVGGDFHCGANHITSLVGGPVTVGGDFHCYLCDLTTLVGAPESIGGGLHCMHNKLVSTFSGEVDLDLSGDIGLLYNELPQQFVDNLEHINLILKYQRHFAIWNTNLTLNLGNFWDLLDDIEEGLE